ncbi:Type IV secretory pathway VirD4 protein-like protein [Kribbella flavida DSM 17836]|uniref:Type IV secretory pathway VirD4 protein-like protein n=1 Tax=Kribbella flavida (strain DSM 17836 / JCM 10339 / NBRC 14399) TaxID=479435 RepID=D2PTF0_KRIFD|nr:TraM recognition domain-containing protein [Kribbella flavida]ADB31263.1 Type IV secretory pathway VirD4 protein-like protein [Kribbella flavida DSM 17836]
MMRRPSARDGVVMPRFLALSVLLVVAGVTLVQLAPSASASLTAQFPSLVAGVVKAGWWMAGAGGVGVATGLLLFWRVGTGLLLAVPLWLVLAGVVASATHVAGGAGGWLIAAGVLVAVSLALVAVNRTVGAGVVFAAWLLYAGLLARVLPASVGVRGYWWMLVAAGAVVLVATVARLVLSRSSSRGLLRRLGRAGRETDGMASSVDVWKGASARVLRRKAVQLRPHLAGVSRWARRRVRLDELGVKIARVGLFSVWSSAEDHTITFGGPRKGKTQQIMKYARKAPGALITTSTKLDLLEHTYRCRAAHGPVWVFDPSGVVQPGSKLAAKLAADDRVSFVRFNPLTGCEVAATAMDRAADLIDGIGRGGDSAGERWDGFAKHVLKSLLHAAALGGYSMFDVQRWVANPSETAMSEVLFELRLSGKAAEGMVSDATQFFKNNPATQSSITTGIMPALSWLSVESAVEAAAPGGQQFDIEQLLATGGSVYLLGKDDNKIAPLVTSLTADLARRAETIAAGLPGQRLDPFLTMVLDEAALICLIPLDKWSGDFGSRGICMHIAAQSRAQLRKRFGDAATGALLTNTATKVVFGGSGDDDDLKYWSTLAGERDEPAVTRDRSTGSKQESLRSRPVLTPGQVGELRARQMLVISNNMPPVVVKTRMYYQTWDVRAERYADRVAAVQAWFVNQSAVKAVTAATDRAEDRAGQWLLDRCSWMLVPLVGDAQVAAGGLRDRATAVVAWLEAADPVRELIARRRLTTATRTARAALAARDTDRAQQRELVARDDRATGGQS